KRLAVLNSKPMQDYDCSRNDLFEKLEKQALRPLPVVPFEVAEWKYARVHLDYHIEIDKHWYSVPFELVHKEVQVKASERLIEVFYDNQRVASHPRSAVPYRHSSLESHLPPHHAAVKNALKP